MKGSHVSPDTIAAVDQIRARQDAQLDLIIAGFKTHADRHGGDVSCPFAGTWMTAETVMRHTDVAGLLAAAVARLAQISPVEMPPL